MARASSIAVFFLVGGTLISASCGGGTLGRADAGPGPSGADAHAVGSSSGLPRETTIANLTTEQIGRLCDWGDNKEGGYGRTVTCPDGSSVSNDPDMATCVSTLPFFGSSCPRATVADAEDCLNAVGTDLCALETAPECERLRSSCPQ
jgi:hypothetical protein